MTSRPMATGTSLRVQSVGGHQGQTRRLSQQRRQGLATRNPVAPTRSDIPQRFNVGRSNRRAELRASEASQVGLDTVEEAVEAERPVPRLAWTDDGSEDETVRPRAYLVFNPVAGQGNLEACLGTIASTLLPSMDLTILQTTPVITAAELTRKAVEEGADIIIASGGDGTISEVAGELISTNKPLAIIPRGTANAFASALGIPTHLNTLDHIRAACEVILSGNQRVVDAARTKGEWGEWPLTLLLGIGLEAETVEMADREMKNNLGVLAYMFAGLQAMSRDGAMFDMTVELGDSQFGPVQSYAATVANIAPATSVLSQGLGQVIPDDGLLEVMAFVDRERKSAVAGIFDLAVKQIILKDARGDENLDSVVGLRSGHIKITCDPPQKVVVDGEVLGNTPVQVDVVPGGLVVLAPLPDEEDEQVRAVEALKAELQRLETFLADNEDANGILAKRAKAIRKQIEKDEIEEERETDLSWS